MNLMSNTQTDQISCMEVWGGNEPAERGVSISGLNAWVYSRPFGQAEGGGDVYYVSSCATGRITRLLVADVSGHGSAVADLAKSLRTLMRKCVNHLDQTRFVQSMNAEFTELSRDGCFATAVVTTFFAPTAELTLCNAGHPPPLHYIAKEKRWTYLEEDDDAPEPHARGNVPLGILDLVDYEQFSIPLDMNDLVLCYTDSLIEARDASGQMLERAGLLQAVQDLDVRDPATLASQLIDKIASRAPGTPWNDDVTVLLFRPNGQGRRVTLKNKLLAPFRVMKSAIGGTMAFPDFSVANLGGAMINSLCYWQRKRSRS